MYSQQLISSPDNTHCKLVRALSKKKRVRTRHGLYVAEGLRLVAQALEAGIVPAFMFASESFGADPRGRELLAGLSPETQTIHATDQVMRSLGETVHSQGVIALLPLPAYDAPIVADGDPVLILDAIRDPGNMGTILRTAAAAGVEAVLAMPGCVDPYAPKVVRAGMGAQAIVPILSPDDWSAVTSMLSRHTCVLADGAADTPYWQQDWRRRLALIIGGEANGAGTEARALATQSVCLPMAQGMESVNAAIATGVLLFEIRRQRSLVGPSR